MPDVFVVPGGKLYFDLFDAAGNPTGERYLGNSQAATLAITPQKLACYDSEDGVAVKADEITTAIDRKVTIRLRNIDLDNLALFAIAAAAAKAQDAGTVTDEPLNAVQQGRYYQLGVAADNPTGVRGISAVTITDDDATPNPFTEGTDYTVDLALARLYIVPGGGITNGTNLRADYSTAANTRDQVVALANTTQQGALRVIASNLKGPARDYYFPKVNITPTGELELKTDPESQKYQELAFEVEVLKRDSATAPMYIDGRPA